MLDVYTAHGMPLTYRHWSYGKRFLQHESSYRSGYTSLAYEVVINSNPCISYLMEENTATMQALVIAHAAFGHNHFFRNNHLFRQWTEASAILDYLEFARSYVAAARTATAWPRWSGCWTRRTRSPGTGCTGMAAPVR